MVACKTSSGGSKGGESKRRGTVAARVGQRRVSSAMEATCELVVALDVFHEVLQLCCRLIGISLVAGTPDRACSPSIQPKSTTVSGPALATSGPTVDPEAGADRYTSLDSLVSAGRAVIVVEISDSTSED
jgi:hypothetical protein